MKTYNVFYSVKEGLDPEVVVKLTQEFVNQLAESGLIQSAQFNKVLNKGNFPEMSDYHLAVHFNSQSHMDDSFQIVRDTLMNQHPHIELMRSVEGFKVTFTESM